MVDPGGKKGEQDRKTLYDIINNPEVILGEGVAKLLEKWTPDIILGHSRFSGPAAILLKQNRFANAKVGYFLHSYPLVEGALLTGYEAFEEKTDVASARRKLEEEKEWIGKSDVVLAMGPLMRWAATLMLEKSKEKPRVHEVISGVPNIEVAGKGSKDTGDEVVLLLSGRANAPVKGFQDIVMAALLLRSRHEELMHKVRIKVRGMAEATYGEGETKRTISHETVQEWMNGVLDEGTRAKLPNGKIIQIAKGRIVESPGESAPTLDQLSKVTVEVLETVSQDQVMNEYQSADAVLSAAYIEHFGLVPLEALACGRPVLVSEFSGAGQFLATRFEKDGEACVVKDLLSSYDRPLSSKVLREVPANAFDERPKKWAEAIVGLVNNIGSRKERAEALKANLKQDYTMTHFAQSVVSAFEVEWDGRTTRQIAKGMIENVPSEQI